MANYEYDIIVIGPFPCPDNIKDGMMQRIAAIDNIISDKKRIYIEISFKKYLFSKHSLEEIDNNLFRLKVNVLNVSKICKLFFNSKKIYIHTLNNILKIMPCTLFTNSEIFFDLHGIVPEEELYRKKYIKYLILSLAQNIFFKMNKNFNIIYITEAMKNYMKSRYNFIANDFVIPIFPKHLYNIKINENKISEIKNKYKIKEDDVIFIYSGNAHAWQKIELMMENIKVLSLNKNYKFFILTGEYQKFKNLLSKYGLGSKENISLESVSPDELFSYYSLAHYGFLLRDKHIINNVACPTKSVEYLTFGIIPIVLEENIGDFKELGYEYISIGEINRSILRPKKSITNMRVSQYIKGKYAIETERLKEALNK